MIPCNECKQCNRKGKPSVMRKSAKCDSRIKIGVKVNRVGLFSRVKDLFVDRRWDEKQSKMKTTKGFRSSWFWR